MIITTTKVYQERVYIPKEIREKFDIENGDTIIWEIHDGELVLRTQREKKDTKKRFKVYDSQ
jgi:AbrB family looped-hinge helix DNA binding protein